MSATPLILPLNRPQYVTSGETLISALAWEVLSYSNTSGHEQGRRYQVIDRTARTKQQTRPSGAALNEFAKALESAGIVHEAAEDVVAAAFLNSIAGVRPARAKFQAASPMTPGLALLQDVIGMTGLPHPVNYAAILETMFVLGAPTSEASSTTMASLWLAAAKKRVAIDPLLALIDRAFQTLYGAYEERRQAERDVEHLRGAFPQSPFGWLHDTWLKLTSDEWVEALPPRVWVDWATTTLRMGLAFGFLWEAERYRGILRTSLTGATGPQPPTARNPELLPWPPAYLPPSSRSVRPSMRRRIDEGGKLRALIEIWVKREGEETQAQWLVEPAFLEDAQRALAENSRPNSLKNVYETVFYALARRDESDHYGLLVPRGTNVTLLDPGTEWVAMVAGLAGPGPKASTHVGKVIEELARLGLRPPVSELVRLLEAAGLARGSADADHGVRVASAFGEGE